MNILYICKLFSSKGNGVIGALKTEIKYLQNEANVALYNLGIKFQDGDIKKIYDVNEYKSIEKLPSPFNKPDLVVFEEIYKLEYIKIYNYCLKKKIPYVIIPHGSLVVVEQNKKKLKHDVANMLLFNRFIKNASAIQFLNEEEKELSHFKYKRSIIIPNGLDYVEREYKKDKKYFKYIYIGRYSIFTKGLDFLLDTFITLGDWCKNNNVILELYGNSTELNEIEQLKEIVRNNNAMHYIKINGPVYDKNKVKALQLSSVFIQTSRHEAQPMGIIEALSYGLPCVVTMETNFGKYCNDNKCGLGAEFNKESLIRAIKKIKEDEEYYKLCEKNSIKCMKRDFEAKTITKKTLKEYQKLIKI